MTEFMIGDRVKIVDSNTLPLGGMIAETVGCTGTVIGTFVPDFVWDGDYQVIVAVDGFEPKEGESGYYYEPHELKLDPSVEPHVEIDGSVAGDIEDDPLRQAHSERYGVTPSLLGEL